MKYNLSADTLNELAMSFVEAVTKAGSVTVKDTKGGNSKYGIWSLDDGSSTNPFDKGITLGVEEAKLLATSHGAPLKLSVDVVLRQLTPVAQLNQALANRKAASTDRLAKLEAEIARLKAQQ